MLLLPFSCGFSKTTIACRLHWFGPTKHPPLPTPKTQFGWSLIHSAAHGGHLDVLALLVEEYECDVNSKAKNGCDSRCSASAGAVGARLPPPHFHRACLTRFFYILPLSLALWLTLRFTALHWAAEQGHLAVVKYLVDIGANVNATNKYGCVPLVRFFFFFLS